MYHVYHIKKPCNIIRMNIVYKSILFLFNFIIIISIKFHDTSNAGHFRSDPCHFGHPPPPLQTNSHGQHICEVSEQSNKNNGQKTIQDIF